MDCILNINKRSGTVSFDIVRQIRKAFHIKKCGYTGTLDPFASGVLPVFTGNFTKLIPHLTETRKRYRFNIALGYETDTLDLTGSVILEKPVYTLINEDISNIMQEHFMGARLQIPPQYSAIKINGKRAYKYARNNEYVDIKPRNVFMHGFNIESVYENGFTGVIEVSRGYYVRAFARDISEKLGTCGTLIELQRISDGIFNIETAHDIDSVSINRCMNIEEIMKHYMTIMIVDDNDMDKLMKGQVLMIKDIKKGKYLVMNEKRNHIVIAQSDLEIMRTIRGII